ncbi:hypothetical protein SUNI508_06001 [Seiridium unicorne]|uniref:Uncharacterized protein n=1 Tax=Seiridium unicorne TaxID=138068 RepID=A0ABR2V3D5_9PEZI
MPDDQNSNNPFVRFKKEIDSQLSQLWHGDRRDVNSAGSPAGSGTLWYPSASDKSSMVSSNSDPDETLLTQEGIAERLRHQSISSWLRFSSYSPENLQFIPQPVPKDTTSFSQRHFTFHDAFEDLLLVRSGQPLRDIEQASSEGRTQTGPFLSFFIQTFSTPAWRASLEERGLWNMYFPRPAFQQEAKSILQNVTALQKSGTSGERPDIMVKYHIRQAARCEEEVKMTSILGHLASLGPSALFGFGIEGSGEVLRELSEVHSPWLRKLGLQESEDKAIEDAPSREPDTLEEVYQAIHSHFAEGSPRSLPFWGNIPITPHGPGIKHATNKGATEQGTENMTEMNTFTSSDGSKTVTKIERRSSNGITQVSITTEKHDSEGRVLERSVTNHRSLSSGGTEPEHAQAREDEKQSGIESVDSTPAGSNGWFWTKRD